ncbi:MAG: hypothetical protein M0D54_04540 [Hyphomonadaceae bacterium JAD_PAG50586_4]|nr:MAG: hypothetical protein M0D54_04540 [Hyphomonadaceae bacterium JAD_PAG50586_4]
MNLVASAFGGGNVTLLGSRGGARELYNSEVIEQDLLSQHGVLPRLLDVISSDAVRLGISRCGILLFEELDEPRSIRYLRGTPKDLVSFTRLNGGLASTRFSTQHGRVQADSYEPLLFELQIAQTTEGAAEL